MTFEIVFVLLSLLGMMAALIADKMRPGMVLFSVVVLFLCVGILTPKEMLEGFSNKGMITVALLFLVSEGIRQSGTLGQVIKKLLPQGSMPAAASASSAFIPWRTGSSKAELPPGREAAPAPGRPRCAPAALFRP